MSLDPTRIDIEFDPQRQHMVGISAHGYQRFDVPFISEVLPDLWLGGCEDGLILPAFISNLVSLSPWETYTVRHELRRTLEVRMLDSVDQAFQKTFVRTKEITAKNARLRIRPSTNVLAFVFGWIIVPSSRHIVRSDAGSWGLAGL